MSLRTLPAAFTPGGFYGRQDCGYRRTQEGPDGCGDGCAHSRVEAGATTIHHHAERVAPLNDVAEGVEAEPKILIDRARSLAKQLRKFGYNIKITPAHNAPA
jgi:hypothetical protein